VAANTQHVTHKLKGLVFVGIHKLITTIQTKRTEDAPQISSSAKKQHRFGNEQGAGRSNLYRQRWREHAG